MMIILSSGMVIVMALMLKLVYGFLQAQLLESSSHVLKMLLGLKF